MKRHGQALAAYVKAVVQHWRALLVGIGGAALTYAGAVLGPVPVWVTVAVLAATLLVAQFLAFYELWKRQANRAGLTWLGAHLSLGNLLLRWTVVDDDTYKDWVEKVTQWRRKGKNVINKKLGFAEAMLFDSVNLSQPLTQFSHAVHEEHNVKLNELQQRVRNLERLLERQLS